MLRAKRGLELMEGPWAVEVGHGVVVEVYRWY